MKSLRLSHLFRLVMVPPNKTLNRWLSLTNLNQIRNHVLNYKKSEQESELVEKVSRWNEFECDSITSSPIRGKYVKPIWIEIKTKQYRQKMCSIISQYARFIAMYLFGFKTQNVDAIAGDHNNHIVVLFISSFMGTI